jgi:hypothetical protein
VLLVSLFMSFAKKVFGLSALLACSTLAACGSSSPAYSSGTSGTSGNTGTQTAAISVFPDTVFVGIDETGKALASAPIGLTGATEAVTWTSSNAAVAAASGSETSGVIAPKKVGTSTVTAKAGAKTATVTVTVLSYLAADKATGETEYTAGKCDGCHTGAGPDITTSGVGKHTDAQILAAVTDGANPEGGDLMSPNHKFTATKAIVAYVRSLAARTPTPIKDE